MLIIQFLSILSSPSLWKPPIFVLAVDGIFWKEHVGEEKKALGFTNIKKV